MGSIRTYSASQIRGLLRTAKEADPDLQQEMLSIVEAWLLDALGQEKKLEAFGPDDIDVLATVLGDVRSQLSLDDNNDPRVTLVARRIINLAQHGVRDRVELRELAMRSMRKSAPAGLPCDGARARALGRRAPYR
jgi:hypothetical protein